ncbi:MAG: GYF domain-containing protein [Bdellovibrionota bacterium]
MKQELFYVARSGQQDGPFSVEDIVAKVKAKALDSTDYCYDEATSDWVMLMAHASFKDSLKEEKPKAVTPITPPPNPATKAAPNPEDWFVLKGDLRFGPFAKAEVVRLLQEKSLELTDYIWTPSMASWERVSDTKTFSADEIRKLKDANLPGIDEAFFQRRHRRTGYGASLLVHDNRRLFKGQGVEISEGGAGFVLDNGNFEPGQKLFMHFKPDADLPSFNAYCEVVSRRSPKSGSDKHFHYGIKFLKIDQTATEKIQQLTQKRQAA